MRLICPSCGAQYEVDDSVIPETGRDVQCSNCGHAWFQQSALKLTTPAPVKIAEPAPQEPVAKAPSAPPPVEEDVAAPETATEPDDTPSAVEDDETTADTPEAAADDEVAADTAEEMPVPSAPEGELRRRTLDDAVRGVLQEEAERETRARKSESAALETQPDLGLAVAAATAAAAPEPVRDRVVRVRGDEDDLDDDALTSRASRRELLPDIEEINSTLRATSERGDEAAARDAPEAMAVRQRSGFRRGFSLAVLIAALALALYVLAPTLAQSVPSLEPALAAYVEAVNAARIWLDGQMQALTVAIKGDAS
ncbi:zinc-ribbon domain-containing protein [Defluviimonas aestuarii]|uniref:zinc-ribbon domain-containing protein n=1 Tax=Albidovulum aestuarii TaxID=1130726 RepID=UPI002499DD98|nr:zinc-ribbon domain-containing protein [Defluviimonas aestuarii]MDI3336468.1 zinc-ribbon domain-containing protein [Defluviimonas aestuarii]